MIKIDKEKFSIELYAEILPLAQKCWNECSITKAETCAYHGDRDFVIEPNVERYQAIAAQDSLILMTLREEGVLKGYVIGVLYWSLHHKSVLCAGVDSVYVEPEFRSYSPVLAEKLEKELKNLGVEIIGWPVTADSPVHELLKVMGYIADDIVMEKRL